MNINPVSNINFNGGSIKNIKALSIDNGDEVEENVNLSVAADSIIRIDSNEVTAKNFSFTLKPQDVKGFYTAYCIAKQLPQGSTIDMDLYKGVPAGYLNLP